MKNQFLKSKFHKWLLNWKPIHLCWFFIRMGWKIPKYLIGKVATAPTASTQAVTYMADTTMIGNGTVVDTGGENTIYRGMCYMTGTSGDPTTANSTTDTSTGGAGAYTVSLTGLSAATAYRVRAYVTNSVGTGYGATVQAYTTPTVALNTPTDTDTGISTTPDLVFTGTSGGQPIEYNVQVDTQSDFHIAVNNYYFDASDASPTDPGNVWTNEAGAFDGSLLMDDKAQGTTAISTNYLMGEGTNAPTSGVTITQVRARFYAGAWNAAFNATIAYADIYTNGLAQLLGTMKQAEASNEWSNYIILSVPSGEWTWQKVNDLEVKLYGAADVIGIGVFKVEIEVTASSSPPLLSKFSVTPDATFTDVTNGADTHPFASGDQIKYTVQAVDTLTAGTTYYWRVAGTDPSGSNTYGAWSDVHSFTTAGGGSVIFGTTVWGQVTGVIETNIRTYASHWTGTGVIELSGDAEVIKLNAGEYMESETVGTGSVTVTLLQNTYASGDNVTIQYRTGATQVACEAASYSTYSAPFASAGYVGIKLVSTL